MQPFARILKVSFRRSGDMLLLLFLSPFPSFHPLSSSLFPSITTAGGKYFVSRSAAIFTTHPFSPTLCHPPHTLHSRAACMVLAPHTLLLTTPTPSLGFSGSSIVLIIDLWSRRLALLSLLSCFGGFYSFPISLDGSSETAVPLAWC
ncbi:hypothetical protein N658DRAFT_139375 [Parathielavia hyrcaniae]|uniref:Uncharacterized protein n=1 Tax=Parathielavia hyrcaniae TaxID=113614 RepID=A0AAN6PY47_9PEZI|nr:hypothetical protein N658DRAFT_139375 [Parathielavia hyrcaniae]